ncbi:hypothetical protein FRC07_009994, partial [Ceratobasidium sp. 392]
AAEASDTSELKAELDKARAQGQSLTVAVVILACTAALLVVSLVVAFIRGRKAKGVAQVTHVTPEALEKAALGKAPTKEYKLDNATHD